MQAEGLRESAAAEAEAAATNRAHTERQLGAAWRQMQQARNAVGTVARRLASARDEAGRRRAALAAAQAALAPASAAVDAASEATVLSAPVALVRNPPPSESKEFPGGQLVPASRRSEDKGDNNWLEVSSDEQEYCGSTSSSSSSSSSSFSSSSSSDDDDDDDLGTSHVAEAAQHYATLGCERSADSWLKSLVSACVASLTSARALERDRAARALAIEEMSFTARQRDKVAASSTHVNSHLEIHAFLVGRSCFRELTMLRC